MTDLFLPQWREPKSLDAAAATISKLGKNLHEHAYLIGMTLIWVKEKEGHGNFIPWIENHVWFGRITAYRMMEFAKQCSQAQRMLEYHREKCFPRKHLESPDSPTCEVTDLQDLIRQGKTFGTIYADPPWEYSNRATRSAAHDIYREDKVTGRSTMTVNEIAALPIKELAADKSHLHLWTTNAFLFECKEIIEAWGFEYKSLFVWVKPQMGIGNYWRVSHEILLLGVRGGLTFADRGLMSWIEADRGEHSVKPERIRTMIESASPGPRLELFARRISDGWTVWGNEIERDIFTHQVAIV